MDTEDKVLYGFVVAMFLAAGLAIYFSVKESNRFRKACEAKGGQMVEIYKSDPLCLPKGSTIDIP